MPNHFSLRNQPWVGRLNAGLLIQATLSVIRSVACLPFDALRAACVTAVQQGLAPRSILASRDVERLVHAMELATLGPAARGR